MSKEKIDLEAAMKNASLRDNVFQYTVKVNVDIKELNKDSFYVVAIKNEDLTVAESVDIAKILRNKLTDNGIANFIIIREKDLDLFEIKDNKLVKVDK